LRAALRSSRLYSDKNPERSDDETERREGPAWEGHNGGGSGGAHRHLALPHEVAHQATHRVADKLGFAMLERAVERLTALLGGRAGERAAVKAGGRAAERAAARVVERAAERAAERTLERAGERAFDVAARASERLAERAGERAAERVAERAGARAAGVAGERLAERAAEQAARRAGAGGARAGLERLGERVAVRLGRGLAIAVPALGSLFVLHLVRGDRRRAVEERHKGNLPASRCFWLAFLCDATDAAAHVVVVTSLLHAAYGIGPALPHNWVHFAEFGGLAVAAASTLAAIAGELLAAGWSWRSWRRGGAPPKPG
jgi:hypothetical protein